MKRTLVERIEVIVTEENRADVYADLLRDGYEIADYQNRDGQRVYIAERKASRVIECGSALEACLFGLANLYEDPHAKTAISEWRQIEVLYREQ